MPPARPPEAPAPVRRRRLALPGPEGEAAEPAPFPTLKALLDEQERLYLRTVMSLGGSRAEQAAVCGLALRTYFWKLRRHGLFDPTMSAEVADPITLPALTRGLTETVARLAHDHEARLRAAAMTERAALLAKLAALPEVA